LWIRNLLKSLAADGRTVFLSSHLMSEMALTADHVIIIGRGRLIADMPVAELTSAAVHGVRVRSPQAELLRAILAGPDVQITPAEPDVLEITGLDGETVGRIAAEHSVVLYELMPRTASLEEAFMELTRDDVEYRAHVGAELVGSGRSSR
jgi:ABC-2 type transport system ATP-binding protein